MIPHILLFALYSGLALFIGLGLPELWATLLPTTDLGLSPALAMALALFVFLLATLVHMTLLGLGRSTQLARQLRNLAQSQRSMEDEVLWLRGEIKAVLEALDAAGSKKTTGPKPGKGSPDAVVEVAAEVRILKSLVAGIYDQQSGKPAGQTPRVDLPRDRAAARPDRDPEGDGELLELVSDPGLRRKSARKQASEVIAGKARKIGLGARAPKAGKLLEGLSKRRTLEFVQKALRDDMIDLVLQPVVTLPKRRKRYYECYSRLRDATGAYILPNDYIPVAEKAGLVTGIDNMLLFRTIQLVRKIQRKHEELDFFCNISSHSLKDADFFGDFVDYLEHNRLLVANLVFEFPQKDFAGMNSDGRLLLRRLVNIGARLSIDQVEELDLDLADLESRGVAFVKVDSALLMEMRKTKGAARLKELVDSFSPSRIRLVVEKLEQDEDLMTLGYLFGEPRLARPAA